MQSGLLPRIEAALIILMCVSFVLIAQRLSFQLYRVGMLTVIAVTILNIAVGNVPRAARGWRALRIFIVIMLTTAAVFALGIVLTPYLARLGQ